MDPKLMNNIRDILSVISVKKQIKDYVESKDVSLGAIVYPPSVKDIINVCDKIEVIPTMNKMDPSTGCFVVDWNMFVYGTHRMDLGTTSHKSINELEHPEPTEYSMQNSKCKQTWGDVIDFIIDKLQKYVESDTITCPTVATKPSGYIPSHNPNYVMNKSVGKHV